MMSWCWDDYQWMSLLRATMWRFDMFYSDAKSQWLHIGRLQSPATWLLMQQLIAKSKVNINLSYYWSFARGSHHWFHSQRSSNAVTNIFSWQRVSNMECVYMSWRHHLCCSCDVSVITLPMHVVIETNAEAVITAMALTNPPLAITTVAIC